MYNQLDIFIHSVENNPESQAHLNENKERLSKQCEKVLSILRSGITLTTRTAPLHGILSLPRRILDLKLNGIEIKERWVKDGFGKRLIKEWFI